MRFKRTEAEVERIEAAMREPAFLDATVLTVAVRTDADVVAELLPPGLEPVAEPLVTAEVVSVGRSNCVGPFDGGGLYVRASHGDHTGGYCLSMPMSTDAAVRWGRATLGEPKKQADVSLDREGDRVRGSAERHDTRLLDIDATLTDTADPRPDATTVFHYKFQPAVDGDGFRADPALVAATIESEPTRIEQGTADLALQSTPHDPLGDLPVEEVLGATYLETDLTLSAEVLTTVDPDAFRPYAHGVGMDDWLAFAE